MAYRNDGKEHSRPTGSRICRSMRNSQQSALGRQANGQFAAGNDAARGRGWRGLVSTRSDPATDDVVVRELAELALRTYTATCRSMPSQSPGVLQMAAAARRSTLAAWYAGEAAKAGLATKDGLALAEASRSHDLAASRHRTAAFTPSSPRPPTDTPHP